MIACSEALRLDYSASADAQRVLRDHEALPDDGRVAILPPVSGG